MIQDSYEDISPQRKVTEKTDIQPPEQAKSLVYFLVYIFLMIMIGGLPIYLFAGLAIMCIKIGWNEVEPLTFFIWMPLITLVIILQKKYFRPRVLTDYIINKLIKGSVPT